MDPERKSVTASISGSDPGQSREETEGSKFSREMDGFLMMR